MACQGREYRHSSHCQDGWWTTCGVCGPRVSVLRGSVAVFESAVKAVGAIVLEDVGTPVGRAKVFPQDDPAGTIGVRCG